MLARKLNQQRANSFIPKLKMENDKIIYKPRDITEAFEKFYANLYSAPARSGSIDHMTQIDTFLSSIKLPKLDAGHSDLLDGPIDLTEVKRAIKETKAHKAPGPDGFTNFYYKQFIDTLAPHLQRLFNDFLSGKPMRAEFLEAKVIVIPKEGKDPSQCKSYRPISLINCDVKLYSKILANRLSQVLPSLIHPDQVGFIQGREAPDNTRRIINLLDVASFQNTPLMLLSLDAEKAFDRIDWVYMAETLHKFGLSEKLVKGILALYSAPTAYVAYQGFKSRSFKITRGTRQGCPLSPLLFALCIEPLAVTIREDMNIRGVRVGETEHKLSLFADDVMLTISEPLVSLPNLFHALELFGRISGFKINSSKSEALNVSLPEQLKAQLSGNFSFKWVQNHIKYLGFFIPRQSGLTYSANFPALIKKLIMDLNTWSSYKISWLGRIHAIKMNILPKLLYLFRTIPTAVRSKDILAIQGAISRFIWDRKRPRINKTAMKASKARGGLALPDLLKYCKATRLAQITKWFGTEQVPIWVEIETNIFEQSGLHIKQVIWLSLHSKLGNASFTNCMVQSLAVLTQTNKRIPLVETSSWIAPLWVYQRTALIDRLSQFKWWIDNKFTVVADLLRGNRQWSITAFREEHHLPLREWLNLSQIHVNISKVIKCNAAARTTPFEKCCLENPTGRWNISIIYNYLTDQTTPPKLHHQQSWESELAIDLNEAQWNKIHKQAAGSSLNVILRENSHKTILRWYLTPARLKLSNPSLEGNCFRGCTDLGTLKHVLWDCPRIAHIWLGTYDILEKLWDCRIPQKPEEALLGLPIEGLSNQAQLLSHQVFLATRVTLAKAWKSGIPTYSEVLRKLKFIYDMSVISADLNQSYKKWASCWDTWILKIGW